MIKKTINRRSRKNAVSKPTPENRYKEATKIVVNQYCQDKESTVYSKYYEYKKAIKTEKDNTGGI